MGASDMMTFWSSGDGTGSRTENELKTIDLSSRTIGQERVAGEVAAKQLVTSWIHTFETWI
jgi:hypothetical protein